MVGVTKTKINVATLEKVSLCSFSKNVKIVEV